MLHYQEAVASVQGDQAYAEFCEQVQQDIVELSRVLHYGAISGPWMRGRPTQQVSEYEFLYGNPDGDWHICRYDPQAGSYGPCRYSRQPGWRDEEAIRTAVQGMERHAERWSEHGAAALEAHVANWRQRVGDEFEILAQGAMLSVPLNAEWLTACALVPNLIGAYLDAQVAVGLQQLEVQAKLGLKIIWGGGDLADNHGPTYGPIFFREVVFPRYARLVAGAHRLGMKYLFRSDGNLWPISDLLFKEIDMDGFGEIDTDAGMRIAELQERYPQLTCWGNVSCRLLRGGSPAEVKEAAAAIIEHGQPRGRLILGSSNTVLPGTPTANYLALLEAAGWI